MDITISKKELAKKLRDFRANCKRLEENNSPVQVLDTAKNFVISSGFLTQKEYEELAKTG